MTIHNSNISSKSNFPYSSQFISSTRQPINNPNIQSERQFQHFNQLIVSIFRLSNNFFTRLIISICRPNDNFNILTDSFIQFKHSTNAFPSQTTAVETFQEPIIKSSLRHKLLYSTFRILQYRGTKFFHPNNCQSYIRSSRIGVVRLARVAIM